MLDHSILLLLLTGFHQLVLISLVHEAVLVVVLAGEELLEIEEGVAQLLHQGLEDRPPNEH